MILLWLISLAGLILRFWKIDFGWTHPSAPRALGHRSILAKSYDLVIVGTTSVAVYCGWALIKARRLIGCSLPVDKSGIVARGQFNEFAGELILVDVTVPERKEKGTEIGQILLKKGYEFEEVIG